MAVQPDAERHLYRRSALIVFDVQLRTGRGQEFDDVVRSLRAKMQRRLPCFADGVHVGAGGHQNFHRLQQFRRRCIVVRKCARAIAEARSEHERAWFRSSARRLGSAPCSSSSRIVAESPFLAARIKGVEPSFNDGSPGVCAR